MLKYAHENHCPWNEKTCELAVKGGHLEVLKYAIENGCRWDAEAIYDIAVRKGDIKIIEYARANRATLTKKL